MARLQVWSVDHVSEPMIKNELTKLAYANPQLRGELLSLVNPGIQETSLQKWRRKHKQFYRYRSHHSLFIPRGIRLSRLSNPYYRYRSLGTKKP